MMPKTEHVEPTIGNLNGEQRIKMEKMLSGANKF